MRQPNSCMRSVSPSSTSSADESAKEKLRTFTFVAGDESYQSHELKKDFYNFLLDNWMDEASMASTTLVRGSTTSSYSRYLDSLKTSPGLNGDLDTLMNRAIRKKLGIIPKNVEMGRTVESCF